MAPRSRRRSRGKAVKEIQAGIRRLTRGFRLLTQEMAREVRKVGAQRRVRVSPGRRRHGRYIGLIRNLPPRLKASVRATRARKGVEAAIRMAKELRRSR